MVKLTLSFWGDEVPEVVVNFDDGRVWRPISDADVPHDIDTYEVKTASYVPKEERRWVVCPLCGLTMYDTKIGRCYGCGYSE